MYTLWAVAKAFSITLNLCRVSKSSLIAFEMKAKAHIFHEKRAALNANTSSVLPWICLFHRSG